MFQNKKIFLLFLLFFIVTIGIKEIEAADVDYQINASGMITDYTGPPGNLVIPSIIKGITVRSIGYKAFEYSGLTKVTFPTTLEIIGEQSFRNNQINELVFPVGLKEIGIGAFYVNSLTSLDLPPNLEILNDWAFESNPLTRVHIPNQIDFLHNEAFLNDPITVFEIGPGVTSLDPELFNYFQVQNFIVSPDNLVYKDINQLGLYSKDGERLIRGTSSGIIAEGTKIIGARAFMGVYISKSTIPRSVETIENYVYGSPWPDPYDTVITILSANATIPANAFYTYPGMIIEGLAGSTAQTYASSQGLPFVEVELPPLENELPGVLTIHSYPEHFSFEPYVIGVSNAKQNLSEPFDLGIDDFTETQNGWRVSILFEELRSNGEPLGGAVIESDFSALSIFLGDEEGLKSSVFNGDPNSFVKNDGDITFNTNKTIISAQPNIFDTTGRFFLTFPTESFILNFDNSTKSGLYSGIATFSLTSTP